MDEPLSRAHARTHSPALSSGIFFLLTIRHNLSHKRTFGMNTQGIAFIGDSVQRNVNDRSRAHVQFSARHIKGASVTGVAQGNVSIGLVTFCRRGNKKTQATAPLL